MSANDWYIWKDLKSGFRVIFVSDIYIPHIRLLGYPVVKYQIVEKRFHQIEKIIDTFYDISKLKKGIFEWKLIVDYRNALLTFLEWHSSTTVLKTYIQTKM